MTVIQQDVVIQANSAENSTRIASSSSEKPSAARMVPRTTTAPTVEATTSKSSSSRRRRGPALAGAGRLRSEEHTSELQSLMRTSYAVFCLKKKKQKTPAHKRQTTRKIS